MNEISYHLIENSFFPKTEHRINMIQVGVPLSIQSSNELPSKLSVSTQYIEKLQKALSLALQDEWSNIVVFPEISIPLGTIQNLMNLSIDIVNSRSENAGGCIVCLPIEHISLQQFEKLIEELSKSKHFIPGDISLNCTNLCEYLLREISPKDRQNSFVNIVVLLVFGQSGPNGKGRYFFQPKRYPYPGERKPISHRFLPGALTYLLDIDGISFMTSICFDLIAQPLKAGHFLSNTIQKGRELLTQKCHKLGSLDYLLLPQCNDKPQDHNFQTAIVALYHQSQVGSQTMRVLSPNVSHIVTQDDKIKAAGHSWFVTCPFGSKLPTCGIWERILPSVLKDPFAKEVIIRDAPSLGHYAHRLRLAADGEWLLHLSLPPTEHLSRQSGPNVPLPPHNGKVYEWNDREWQEKDLTLFVQHCHNAERLPGLQVLAELADWVQMNLGGGNTYSPSYYEFIEQRVQLPKNDRSRVLSLLKSQKDVWLRGDPACGKTVFGISIALDWMADRNGRCLFCDIKDLEFDGPQFLGKAKADIDWFVQIVPHPLLFVLDNVHTDQSLSLSLLKHIQEKRDLGMQIQTLLIGRHFKEPPTERKSLIDNAFLEPIDLKANEEAFMCVAKRISLKRGVTLNCTPSQGIKWVRECGGDLVVFSTAFDPMNPENIDQSFISKMVRQRYISPIEQQGERGAFLDLCAMSSLDINTPDFPTWGRSAESIFAQFISNGAIQCVTLGAGNPREYCRLFHSSLGDLILRVETNFSRMAKQKLWLKLALDMCRRHPSLLSIIYFKLSTGSYDEVADLNQWCDAVNSDNDLIERAVCHSPSYTMTILRKGRLNFPRTFLQKISNMSEYNLLIANLARTRADFIVPFLKHLDNRKLSEERNNLLGVLLENDAFKESLARTPANIIVMFLKYLDNRKLSEERNNLLGVLLENDAFKESLARTPAGDVVTFLKYLDNRKLSEERTNLLEVLLENDAFQEGLARTQAHCIIPLLEYLDRRELSEENNNRLGVLLENDAFKEALTRTPVHFIVPFLKYLDRRELSEERKILLEVLLKNDAFQEGLPRTPVHYIVPFLKHLDRRKLSKESNNLLEVLLENDAFQEGLPRTRAEFIVPFLEYLDRRELSKESNNLLEVLLENDAFKEGLARAQAGSTGNFIGYLVKTGKQSQAQQLE